MSNYCFITVAINDVADITVEGALPAIGADFHPNPLAPTATYRRVESGANGRITVRNNSYSGFSMFSSGTEVYNSGSTLCGTLIVGFNVPAIGASSTAYVHSSHAFNFNNGLNSCAFKINGVLTPWFRITNDELPTEASGHIWAINSNDSSPVGGLAGSIALPDAPTVVSPGSGSLPGSTVSTLTPAFIWNASAHATSYRMRLERKNGGSWDPPVIFPAVTSSDLTYTLAPAEALVDGDTYRWAAYAQNCMGFSPLSAYSYFTVSLLNYPTLGNPGTVGAPGTPQSTVTPTFTWSVVASATDYSLTVEHWNGAAWVTVNTFAIANPADTSYALTVPDALTAGDQYRWTMASHDANGWTGNAPYLYFTISATPPSTLPPPVLTTLGPTQNTATPTFEWAPVTGATGYELWLYTFIGGVQTLIYDSGIIAGTSMVWGGVPALVDGTTYRWQMATENGAGLGNPSALDEFRYSSSSAPGALDGQLPAAGPMDYYMGRIWYGIKRIYTAGDIVGGSSGTVPYQLRDSILYVTENPLAAGGDGFCVPSNAGNIRAITHPASIDAALGEGKLTVLTHRSVFQLAVPVTRAEWIGPTAGDMTSQWQEPLQTVAQKTSGTNAERSVVSHNGDIFYVGSDIAVHSFLAAVRYFGQWGNTPISSNVARALDVSDKDMMRYSSGISFDNRLLMTVCPVQTPVGVAFQGIVPLDFDLISSLQEKLPPAWEGMWEGLNVLQVFQGMYGGVQRAFAVVAAEDGGIDVWEMTLDEKRDNGDNRIEWYFETPAWTWGKEMELKALDGGEIWLDQISGTVDIAVFYRADSDPCWHEWHNERFCTARSVDEDSNPVTYPEQPYQQYCPGHKSPLVLPKPGYAACDTNARPSTQGYQFQAKVVLRGYCRIRGIVLHSTELARAPYSGLKG